MYGLYSFKVWRLNMIDSRDLKELHPTVAAMAANLIKQCKTAGITLLVTSTYRDFESQNALYAEGRTTSGCCVTRAKAGQSFHNFRAAFDVVPLREGKPIWHTSGADASLWQQIAAIGKSCGLSWGGDWTSLKDMLHFQYTAGLTLQDFQMGKTLPAHKAICV
jgi:peptidoglycan LD-endopeptidase CwlK